MAITVNDSLQNNSPKPVDAKYLKNSLVPYTSVADVNLSINSAYRHKGLTVAIAEAGVVAEFWYKDGTTDGDLVQKNATPIRTITSSGPFNILPTDESILVDATGGTVPLTGNPALIRQAFQIKRIDNSANVVTFTPTSGLIDGLHANVELFDQGAVLRFRSTGSIFYIF